MTGATRPRRRLHAGRWQIYIEPRDLWIGAYVAEQAVYVCPVPLVVIRIDRPILPARIIQPPKGPGRWQTWVVQPGRDDRLCGRYRTRINALLVAAIQNRLAARDGLSARFEVRRTLLEVSDEP